MALSIFDARPPYVKFEEREMGLNPVATEKEGRPIPRTVVLALITAHGSKDTHESIAEEWLATLKNRGLNGDDYSQNCYEKFSRQFAAWKEGHDLPREGTPIKTWAMATREQITRLIGNGITTVEDLAAFPDSNLNVVGMDGRYLRDIARGWMKEAKDLGANAKALADANVKIERLEKMVQDQSDSLRVMRAQLESDDMPRRRGRPPKNHETAAA